MVNISVITPTARDDYSILGQPRLHYLEPTMKSLAKQSFKDFELVIVDALHGHRDYDFSGLPFPVKHIPVHPGHRFWLDRKRWSVCAALNTGIIHSEGELIVRIDDCSEFDSGYLERCWEKYLDGVFLLGMHIRYHAGKPARVNKEYLEEGYESKYSETFEPVDRAEFLKRLYGEGGLVRDSRFPLVEARGGEMIAFRNWMYGYSSFSLDAALKVNGFDENFDGDKSIEDQDFGNRLWIAGYRDMFLLDVNHTVIEHEHKTIPGNIITHGLKPIKCNYALYLINERRGRWRANVDDLTEEDYRFVVNESLKPPCSPQPSFYEDDCAGELFRLWKDRRPDLDLREERMEI